MSRLYGDLTGSAKTTATRRGSAASGVSSHVRGWNTGLRAAAHVSDDVDTFNVVLTAGSNGGRPGVGVFEAVETEYFGAPVVKLTLDEDFGGGSFLIHADGRVSPVLVEQTA